MFSILDRALSWAITIFGNKFCLKKRSRLIKALDNRFYVKFMQLEIGLLCYMDFETWLSWAAKYLIEINQSQSMFTVKCQKLFIPSL